MAQFSKESKAQLATCHPELQLLFNTVIDYFDCTIIEGYRNEKDQNAAFKKGNSKLKYPNGLHNKVPSMAVDASPFPVQWANINRFYWFGGYVLGVADMLHQQGKMKYKVQYGGDWDRDFDITDEKGLIDLVHFEIILP